MCFFFLLLFLSQSSKLSPFLISYVSPLDNFSLHVFLPPHSNGKSFDFQVKNAGAWIINFEPISHKKWFALSFRSNWEEVGSEKVLKSTINAQQMNNIKNDLFHRQGLHIIPTLGFFHLSRAVRPHSTRAASVHMPHIHTSFTAALRSRPRSRTRASSNNASPFFSIFFFSLRAAHLIAARLRSLENGFELFPQCQQPLITAALLLNTFFFQNLPFYHYWPYYLFFFHVNSWSCRWIIQRSRRGASLTAFVFTYTRAITTHGLRTQRLKKGVLSRYA